jgi:nitroimidazol reductase NimA-like FMN-containing flavoprotein (pyridoxamine 5'-phosphate oxidase superfamily)
MIAELDGPYSSEGAKPTPWTTAREQLDKAEVYWLSTVRADGRPHVTPVVAVWMNGSLYFSTGPDEQKAKNLRVNAHVVITTGCNVFHEGLDVVVEGDAVKVSDEAKLRPLADGFAAKYEDAFGFRVRDGAFVHGEGGVAHVYEVDPVKAFSYLRGEEGSATRYRF